MLRIKEGNGVETRILRDQRLTLKLMDDERSAYDKAALAARLDLSTWARQVLNEAAKAHFIDAPNTPKAVDKSAPAGPGNPTKNRVMHGGERLSWESYYAGRLVDNNGPGGAPRFGAVMRDPRFADNPAAHIVYGEAMRECFERGVPVQPGDDHAWSRYLRENT